MSESKAPLAPPNSGVFTLCVPTKITLDTLARAAYETYGEALEETGDRPMWYDLEHKEVEAWRSVVRRLLPMAASLLLTLE